MKPTSIRLLTLLCAGFIGSITASQAQSLPANLLLRDISSELGGSSSFIKWTNIGSGDNPALNPHSQSTASGSLRLIAGFRASNGFYNWSSDFGEVIKITSSPNPIKTAVLQVAMLPNPSRTHEEHFNYNHSTYYQPGDTSSGTGNPNDPNGVNSYAYVEELGNMANLIENYTGGPLLKWTTASGFGYLQAIGYGFLGEPVEMTLGHAGGLYYNFAWQWDLSAIPGNILEVEVINATVVHSSTLGLQLTVGDTFNALFAVPEPSFYAAVLGFAGLAAVYRRRQKAARV